jgi:hypothetical protein
MIRNKAFPLTLRLATTPDGYDHVSPLATGHRRRGSGLTTDMIPELERAIILSRHKGRTVYVDSGVTASGNGDSWGGAYSTLAAALNASLSDDLILVAPGHAEAVTATNLAMAKARVSVVGLGQGASRPTFTWGAAAATITVSAAGCSISNLHCISDFLDVTSAITLTTAKDFRCDGCSFLDSSAAKSFLSIVTTGATANAADGLTFTNNTVIGMDLTTTAVVSILGALDRLYVADNFVDRLQTNDAGQLVTIAANVIRAAQILRNFLILVGSSGAVGILITGSSTTNTGIVAYNFVYSLDTTTVLLSTVGLNLAHFENYYPDAVATSGAIWPVATGP